MTFLESKNINEPIRHKLRIEDVYKTDIQNIYNLIVGQNNEQLQENVASKATLQVIKTG